MTTLIAWIDTELENRPQKVITSNNTASFGFLVLRMPLLRSPSHSSHWNPSFGIEPTLSIFTKKANKQCCQEPEYFHPLLIIASILKSPFHACAHTFYYFPISPPPPHVTRNKSGRTVDNTTKYSIDFRPNSMFGWICEQNTMPYMCSQRSTKSFFSLSFFCALFNCQLTTKNICIYVQRRETMVGCSSIP